MNFFCDLFFALTHMSIFAEFWSRLFWFKNLHWPKICSSQKAFISETSPEFCFLFKMEEKWVIVILEYCKICNFTKHSVQFSRSVMSDSLWPHESQHARPPCSSPTPGVHSDTNPSSQRWHPAISSSVIPLSSCSQSLLASGSFPLSQLFAWGGQSIGVSDLASLLPKKSQGWSPLEWTGWISLQSKGLLRVFSNTTVQKHQFFGTQLSSQSNSHIHTWPQEKP